MHDIVYEGAATTVGGGTGGGRVGLRAGGTLFRTSTSDTRAILRAARGLVT